MSIRNLKELALFALLLTVCGTTYAGLVTLSPNYFVRPYILEGGGGVIDGLQQNGPTSASQHFGTDFQSSVDLGTGAIKVRAKLNGQGLSGTSAGIFGERVKFTNTTGSPATADVSFAFDGNLTSGVAINSGLAGFVSATLYVYDPSVGANASNFNSSTISGQALVAKKISMPYVASVGSALNEAISDVFTGTLDILGQTATFDMFASLSISLTTNQNPVQIEGNFLNTGTFGISTGPGVTFTSSSGVFLKNSSPQAAVSEPHVLTLLSIGLVVSGWMRKKRSQSGLRRHEIG